jgi:hypothetical protein
MFELVRQIRSWREHLAGDGVYTPSDLDELEVHLQEEMIALAGKGLSEQEAFTIACMRVGDAKALAQEFAKVNTGLVFKRRLFWMGGGVLGAGFSGLLATIISRGAAWVAAYTGLRGYTVGILTESTHVLAVLVLIMGLLTVARQCPGGLAAPAWLRTRRRRVVLVSGLVALNLVLLTCPLLLTAGTAHMLGPRDFGEIALVTGYANLCLTVAWSCLLIGWMTKAWTSATASP